MASLNLASLEQRLGKLTGRSADTKSTLIVRFGDAPHQPLMAKEWRVVIYLRQNEPEADFLERVVRENPPIRTRGTVIYPV